MLKLTSAANNFLTSPFSESMYWLYMEIYSIEYTVDYTYYG